MQLDDGRQVVGDSQVVMPAVKIGIDRIGADVQAQTGSAMNGTSQSVDLSAVALYRAVSGAGNEAAFDTATCPSFDRHILRFGARSADDPVGAAGKQIVIDGAALTM